MAIRQPATDSEELDTYQLHVELGGLTLQQFVEAVARASLEAIRALPGGSHDERAEEAAVEGVRSVLERHIVAYDTCGLGSLCHEAERVNPWTKG